MDKYLMLGLCTVFAVVLFFGFSDGDCMDYEHDGIVHDVRETSNGYIFFMDTDSGNILKCFSRTEPAELGHYMINGNPSDDGSLYFVQDMIKLDNYKHPMKN